MAPKVLIAMALAVVSVPLSAAPDPVVRQLTIYGNDRCPEGTGDEIVVCAREPESERYRIPKRFRSRPRETSGPGASWATRVEGLEAAQRFTRPDGCSPVGSAGQSGCSQAWLRQWYAEREQKRAEDAVTP